MTTIGTIPLYYAVGTPLIDEAGRLYHVRAAMNDRATYIIEGADGATPPRRFWRYDSAVYRPHFPIGSVVRYRDTNASPEDEMVVLKGDLLGNPGRIMLTSQAGEEIWADKAEVMWVSEGLAPTEEGQRVRLSYASEQNRMKEGVYGGGDDEWGLIRLDDGPLENVYRGRLTRIIEDGQASDRALGEPTTTDADATITALRAEVEAQRTRLDSWERRWRSMAVRMAHEAQNRGWCSEYDDIAAEMGLPNREDLAEPVSYTITATLSVIAGVELPEAFTSVTIDDPLIQVEVELEGENDEALGGCTCSSIDAHQQVRDALYDSGVQLNMITSVSISCEADDCVSSN